MHGPLPRRLHGTAASGASEKGGGAAASSAAHTGRWHKDRYVNDLLLGVATVDSHPQEVLDLVAAATADLFQGQSVTTIEQLFRRSRGQVEDGRHYFQEIVVFSDNLLHVFQRGRTYQEHAAVFVCRSEVNIGMALTKSRLAARDLEGAV